MLKLSDNPEPLSPSLTRPSDASGQWCVVHTKPRMEKALATELARQGLDYYLPLARQTYVSGGRRRVSLIPLFPSYLFFAGDADDKVEVLRTNRVVSTIPIAQQARFVSEITCLHAALSVKDDLIVYPHVAVGKRCRVVRGPMRGIEGVVVQDDDLTRIVLSVSILGRGAALEISAADLEESS